MPAVAWIFSFSFSFSFHLPASVLAFDPAVRHVGHFKCRMRFLLMSNINARCLAFTLLLLPVVNKRSVCGSPVTGPALALACDCIAFDMRWGDCNCRLMLIA